jgi:hypothetical protein
MHAERGEVWQMRLLDARRFAKFADDRGVRPGGGPRDGIERLWQVGWLATDLVKVAPGTPKAALVDAAGEGFVEVGTDEDGYRLYADARTTAGGATGRVGGAAKLADLPREIRPLFHPFRYHVLHWLDGMLRLNITSLSTLTTAGPDSLAALTKRVLGWKDERFGSPSFSEDIREFNDQTAFAIVTEPLYYGRIFGHRTARTGYEPEELDLTWDDYVRLDGEERRRLSLDLFERRVREHEREVAALYE